LLTLSLLADRNCCCMMQFSRESNKSSWQFLIYLRELNLFEWFFYLLGAFITFTAVFSTTISQNFPQSNRNRQDRATEAGN
jgi:hypothetical protein